MKLGLDVHGVITKNPTLFAKLTSGLILRNHTVHILTGVEDGDRIRLELANYGITYTDFFSITSEHKRLGTHMIFKNGDPNHPLIAPPKWDCTKANYCQQKMIDIHIDDSSVYGQYFEYIDTQYILYNDSIEQFLTALLGEFS